MVNWVGQKVVRSLITNVTQSIPCQVTTQESGIFFTGDQVMITDLNSMMPVIRGMDEINNKRFSIVVTSPTTFNLYWPVSGKPVNSTTYPAYVEGGFVDLIAHNFIYEAPNYYG